MTYEPIETAQLARPFAAHFGRRNAIVIDNLQTLRTVAAVLIVLHHSISFEISRGQLSAGAFHERTRIGVDLFFVLSGFLMVIVQSRSKRSPGVFLWNRVARIVPAYFILTSLFVAILFLAPGLTAAELTTERLIDSFTFTSVYSGAFPYIFVGWTLEYEMLFYAVFALSLFAPRLWHSGMATTIALLVIAGFTPLTGIVLNFVTGMVAGFIFLEKEKRFAVSAAVLGGGVLLLTLLGGVTEPRWFVWGIPGAVLVYGLSTVSQARQPVLLLLGDASYSIYLVQVFTLPAYYKFAPDLPAAGGIAISCIVTIIAGVVFYLMVEKPVGKLIRTSQSRPAAQALDN